MGKIPPKRSPSGRAGWGKKFASKNARGRCCWCGEWVHWWNAEKRYEGKNHFGDPIIVEVPKNMKDNKLHECDQEKLNFKIIKREGNEALYEEIEKKYNEKFRKD